MNFPIPLRMIEVPFGEDPKWETLQVGDAYFLTGLTEAELRMRHLSDQYFRDNSFRAPLIIVLPPKTRFVVDAKCFSRDRGYYEGWKVEGHPPFISITPSINLEGTYHGFIGINGVPIGHIGNDLDGRKYE